MPMDKPLATLQEWLMHRGVCWQARARCNAPMMCDQYCARYVQTPMDTKEAAVLATVEDIREMAEQVYIRAYQR